MELILGSHVSFLKGSELLGSVESTLSYNANAFMFYTGPNQSSLRGSIDSELTKKAHILMEKNNILTKNVFVHAPFIINLANDTDEHKYNFYISFLKSEIGRCKELGINNLVLHPGSRTIVEKNKAIDNIAYGINKALEDVSDFHLILEFMSGKGSEVGSSLDDLKDIYDKVIKKELIFFCIDTCHLNDSGVSIAMFDQFLNEFDLLLGLSKLALVHLNDSMNEVGAHKDRHANIGYGTIGFDTLMNVVYNTKLKGVPFILETPFINRGLKDSYAPYKYEIENIRNKVFVPFSF
ncbi:MAG: deoxyribonuclease IV [Bacilli bacterium]